jgi:hypothetical protein
MFDFFASFVTYIDGDLSGSNSPLFLASGRQVGNMVFSRLSAERFCSNLMSGSFVWYASILHEDAAKAGKIGSFIIGALLSHQGNTSLWSSGELSKEARSFSGKF